MSFDVCASCEAHAILYSINNAICNISIETAPALSELSKEQRKENVHFQKCPTF